MVLLNEDRKERSGTKYSQHFNVLSYIWGEKEILQNLNQSRSFSPCSKLCMKITIISYREKISAKKREESLKLLSIVEAATVKCRRGGGGSHVCLLL